MDNATRLTGVEDAVFFVPGQSFTGVSEEWLLKRLRVSPSASPVDLSPDSDRGPLGVLLDGLWVDVDAWDVDALTGDWREIATAKDQQGLFDASAEVAGGWLRDSWPEVRLIYTWVGPSPDLHTVALDWAHDYVTEWVEMGGEAPLELTSRYLSTGRQSDRTRLSADVEGPGRLSTLNGKRLDEGPRSMLTGAEDVVWFVTGDEFVGATEAWLRPRLRLDPAQHYFDLDYEGLHISLDDEIVEDLDLEAVLGSGPHDGKLIAITGPNDSGASGYIQGGWLETIAPDMSHDIVWIGLDPDFTKIIEDWVTFWVLTWGDIEVTFNRLGIAGGGTDDNA